MTKLSEMRADADDLRLKWDDRVPPTMEPLLKEPFPRRRLEEYFDFLEAIGPLPKDETPAKLYGERFVV